MASTKTAYIYGEVDYLRRVYNRGYEEALMRELNKKDYGEFSLTEIGKVMGISRERVRQIEAQALKKLMHPSINRELRDYLYYIVKDESKLNYGRGSEILVKEN